MRNFYLISYDIPNDKRRLKIAHLLEGYGERVQYSVFEVWAHEDELAKLRERLERLVQEKPTKEDEAARESGSVRIYHLCVTCQHRREVLGEGEVADEPDLYVF